MTEKMGDGEEEDVLHLLSKVFHTGYWEKGEDLEYIMVVLWERGEEVVIINYYNPCKRLEVDKLLRIQGNNRHKVIWCADFNAHSKIWGGSHTDVNGRVIEDLMDDKELVCINDGRGTRINITTGNEAALDITLVSNPLAGISHWHVWNDTTVGSDHYPVSCSVGERVEIRPGKECQNGVLEEQIG